MVSLALILSFREASFSSSCRPDKWRRLFAVGQSSRTKSFFFKVAVCFTFMCSCLAFYSYHSVQRQWPPFTLRFAGYWGDCCYGILEMNEVIFSFHTRLLYHFICAGWKHLKLTVVTSHTVGTCPWCLSRWILTLDCTFHSFTFCCWLDLASSKILLMLLICLQQLK